MSTDDFLKRERELLGDDADLFASSTDPASSGAGTFDLPATDFPDLDDNSTLPSAPPPASSAPDAGFPSIDSLDGPSFPQPQVNITDVEPESEVDKEMDQFQSSYPDVDDLLPAELKPVPIASNFTYGSSPYSPGPSTPAPAQASAKPASPESEHVVAWRAKQAEEIKKRDEKSKEVREEKVRKAERDIDAFYEEYNKGKEQAIKENKENEATFLSNLESKLGEGTTWSRIADLVGLENSQSKTLARALPGGGGSDLARMKEALLKLKRQGDAAPGAAGY